MDFKDLIDSVGISVEDMKNVETETIELDADRNVETFEYNMIVDLCPKAVGNPYGTSLEKEEFMKWVVETPYVRYGSNFLITAITNFGNEITTEFIQSLTNLKEETTRRIRDLRKKIGYQVVPMNHYYREYILTKSKTDFVEYGFDRHGKIVFNSKGASVGNFTRRNSMRAFQRWIPNRDYRSMMESLERLRKRVIEKADDKHYFKEITLKNLFCVLEGREGKRLENPLTEREYKTIMKLKNGKQKLFVTKCEFCKGLIKFPLTPNCDSDKHEKLAHSIYTAFLNRIEGVVLCKKCMDNIWCEEDILEMVNGLNKEKQHQMPMDLFCQTFRKDGRARDGFDVEKDVGKILRRIGRKVSVEGNLLTIK